MGSERVERVKIVPGQAEHVTPRLSDSEQTQLSKRQTVIQAKMQVGAVDDPAEHEADRIADDVVQRLAAGRATSLTATAQPNDRVQRASAPAASTTGGFAAPADVEARIQRAAGSGAPLEPAVRSQFEGAMGADLSAVRIHRSPTADALNTDLQARAFTAGNDVFFSTGSYAPQTSSGQHLLAHELAHTVQQQPRVRRKVIRRLSLNNTDFAKTTSVNVFQKGGSGNVAEFNDGSGPLIIKVDQLIGNEVVAAGNLHSGAAAASGGEGGYSVTSPRVRLATPVEKQQIATATTRLLKPTDSPRNFLTGITKSNPTVIMEKSGGQDFSDVLSGGGHTKKGLFGKTVANKDSIVFKITSAPGPLTTLAQALPVDVAMGMFDRLIGYYNPDNFRYDDATKSFGFVDNTQNGAPGFITSVDIGGIFTNKEAFDAWSGHHHVNNLASNPANLAQSMYDTLIDGIAGDLDATTAPLFKSAATKNKGKMLGWINSGIAKGKRSLLGQLANPLPLLNGIGDAQKPEALQSLIAKRKVFEGVAPAKAWTDAGVEALQILPPPVTAPTTTPWQSATPNKATANATSSSGTSSGGGSSWKSAQPAGRWKSAQPAGRWKRATPSKTH